MTSTSTNASSTVGPRVGVIGGGISGLAAAHHLHELDPRLRITLLEAGARLGGVLETDQHDGFLIERSADNFISNVPWAVDLCRRVGLGDQLIETSRHERNAMIVHRGRLVRVPAGFQLLAPAQLRPLLSTPLLSFSGKARLLAERFVPRRRTDEDESLANFARRRLGREVFERIVQPLVGGIYTADPEKLSLQATLPRFLQMEQQYGSLIRAARAMAKQPDADTLASGARYSLFLTLRDGLTSLVQAVAARLPEGTIRLNAPVTAVEPRPDGPWRVHVADGSPAGETMDCDAVIVATPSPVAGQILTHCDAQLSADLGHIEYAGTAIVALGFRRDQLSTPLDSFGFVVPAVEKRRILAGSFSSVKFAGRAPDDQVLVRVFLGGACQPELLQLDDEQLRAIAVEELRSLLGIQGGPQFADVIRWPRSMPQYHVGHVALIQRIERACHRQPALALAGNAYHGVGIPNCIHSGESAARQIVTALAERNRV